MRGHQIHPRPGDGDPHLVIQPRTTTTPTARRLIDELFLEQVGRYDFADAPTPRF